MKKQIIVCDKIHKSGLALLNDQDQFEIQDLSSLPKDELLRQLGECAVAITRSSTDVDEPFLQAAKNIKAIVRAGVGVDNVDIEACSKRGVIVMNVPTANTIAAVEMTMAHMLSCARSFPYAHNHLKNDRIWKREKWYGVELKDKKLGVIGFGNIGSRVGIRAKAFDMEVITYDPYINPSKAIDLGVTYTKNFEDILECDFITIHTPKNHETINMISHEEIAKMKDGVRLINCARGGLYNEDALYDNLKSGKIAFAGIDVFEKEPATDHKLLDLENISVTPHLGANTVESQNNIAVQAAESALSAIRGVSFPNALNLPIDEAKIPSFVKPYLGLMQKIAHLGAQANKYPITSVEVFADGAISEYIDSLQTFGVVGALKESLGDKINYVNAEFVAKEKNITIKSTIHKESDTYKNKIGVKITTSESAISIYGSVFEGTKERIVAINDFQLDIVPKGKMILFKNTDIPGVVGDFGHILASHNINISDLRLSRDIHKRALAVILVDETPSKEVMKELSNLDACIRVEYVVL
jgi:D-3-phosphoglycerate dehydrogenase